MGAGDLSRIIIWRFAIKVFVAEPLPSSPGLAKTSTRRSACSTGISWAALYINGRAMGGYAERIEDPEEIRPAFQRARRMTEEGKPVLLEFITASEVNTSHKRAF